MESLQGRSCILCFETVLGTNKITTSPFPPPFHSLNIKKLPKTYFLMMFSINFFNGVGVIYPGCVPFPTIASNLLAFSSKMADVAATSTDKRSVTLLTTYNTRSVHAVTHRAQQNLRDFTAIRPCFQQFAVDNMDDNVSRSNITTTSNNLLAIASARNTCYVAFQIQLL